MTELRIRATSLPSFATTCGAMCLNTGEMTMIDNADSLIHVPRAASRSVDLPVHVVGCCTHRIRLRAQKAWEASASARGKNECNVTRHASLAFSGVTDGKAALGAVHRKPRAIHIRIRLRTFRPLPPSFTLCIDCHDPPHPHHGLQATRRVLHRNCLGVIVRPLMFRPQFEDQIC
jgi:hypothetical protein